MKISSIGEFRAFLDRTTGTWKLDGVDVDEHVWDQVCKDPELIEEIVLLKKLPEKVLRTAAQHPSPRVRSCVASKRALPKDLFHQLARDPSSRVRLSIAMNKKTPQSVLEYLADDSWDYIRDAIAKRLRSES